jgi:protein MAK11
VSTGTVRAHFAFRLGRVCAFLNDGVRRTSGCWCTILSGEASTARSSSTKVRGRPVVPTNCPQLLRVASVVCAGTVTCAEIWGGTHLLTGSEDKTVVVWRTKDWVSLSTLRGHKEKISALAVHPSGKLTLVSDRAGTLYLWNLTSAKCVFRHRTPESSVLRWSPDGQAYASVHNDKVEVSTTGAETLCTLAAKGTDGDNGAGRVFDVAFVDDNVLLTGGEDRKLSAWDLRTGSSVGAAEGTSRVATQPKESSAAFSSRVKAIKTFEVAGAKYCAAASAQGSVAVYDLRQFGAEPVMTYDTRSRLTCMQAVATFEGEDEDDSEGTYDFEQSTSEAGSRANDDERSDSSMKRRKR